MSTTDDSEGRGATRASEADNRPRDEERPYDEEPAGAEPDRRVVETAEPEPTVVDEVPTPEDVLAREKARYGGMKFGSAFFGWLTATGTAAILGAIVAAIRVGVTGTGTRAVTQATWLDIVLGVVVLFIAYLAGGYVAGRMARFNGARQGIAVWLWALVIAIVVGVVGAIVGSQWDILANLQSFPRLPFTGQSATVVGIVGAIILLVVTLVGAILGGVAGMGYHRRVDRAGWESNRHLSAS